MKRTKKTIEKRTYSLKAAIPTWVSLVGRGANFTPFSQLKYDESEQFGQDVEIHRVEFSKQVFDTQDKVDAYLTENNFEEFSIEENDDTWVVLGVDADKFQEVQPVEYEDGVLYFIGKLKEEVEAQDAPAAEEVVAVEEFAETPVEEVTPEVTKEFQEEAKDEEAESTGEEATSEEVSSDFTAEVEQEKEEVTEDKFAQFMTTEKYSSNYASFREVFDAYRNDRNTIPSFDMLTYAVNDCNYAALSSGNWAQFQANLNDYYSAVFGMVSATKNLSYSDEQVVQTEEDKVKISEEKFSELMAEVEKLKEKVEKFEEKEKETIDEEEVLIQNSQSIQSDEIIVETIDKTDAKAEAFGQKRKNDLFGL